MLAANRGTVDPEIELHEFFLTLATNKKVVLADLNLERINQEQQTIYLNGSSAWKWAGVVGLSVVTGGAGFALAGGLASGFTTSTVTAAVVGASLGYTLGDALFNPDKPGESRQNTYSFNVASGDSIATQGDVVPIVYCNGIVNPKGGVRYSGKIVSSAVKNQFDNSYLNQVYALSLGEIGSIDFSKTLIDRKELNQFYSNDLTVELLQGTPSMFNPQGQPGFSDDIKTLSQTVSPSSFTKIGTNNRAERRSADRSQVNNFSSWTTFNCFLNSDTLTKNSGQDGTADAYAYTNDNIGEGGGSFAWKLINGGKKEVGFGVPGGNTLNYSITNNEDGTVALKINSSTYNTDGNGRALTWSVNDIFEVDLSYNTSNNKIITFSQNATPIRTFIFNWTDLHLKAAIYDLGSSLNIESAAGIFLSSLDYGFDAGTINSASNFMRIKVYEEQKYGIENFDSFSSSEVYEIGGQQFFVIGKNYDTREITISPIVDTYRGQDIWAKWIGKYQTSRKINEITFNFSTLLFSKYKPEE